MDDERDALIDWRRRARGDALRQLELFGPGGVKAMLRMPDGSTQDITDAVVRHQTENAPMFERLMAALAS